MPLTRVGRFAVIAAILVIVAYIGVQLGLTVFGAECEVRDALDGYMMCNELGDVGYAVGLGALPVVALALLILMLAGVWLVVGRVRRRRPFARG